MLRIHRRDGLVSRVIAPLRRRARVAWWRAGDLLALAPLLPRRIAVYGKGLFHSSRLGQWAYVIGAVRADYRRVTGCEPCLFRPRRFTEKMQWRKLFELDPLFAILSDKLAARDYVAARVGPGRQADLLWVGEHPDDIPFDRLDAPYVLKTSHACGQILIVRDRAALDIPAAKAMAGDWLAHCHGTGMHEPGYIHVPRRLMVERLLLCADGTAPPERKIYVFDGRVAFIRTNIPDAHGHPLFADVHSPDWVRLPITWEFPIPPVPPARPARLEEMIDLAGRLAAGLSHGRVDIYDRGEEAPVVGEISLYSQSGLTVYGEPESDFTLGSFWTIRWPLLRACWAIAFRRWAIHPP